MRRCDSDIHKISSRKIRITIVIVIDIHKTDGSTYISAVAYFSILVRYYVHTGAPAPRTMIGI